MVLDQVFLHVFLDLYQKLGIMRFYEYSQMLCRRCNLRRFWLGLPSFWTILCALAERSECLLPFWPFAILSENLGSQS